MVQLGAVEQIDYHYTCMISLCAAGLDDWLLTPLTMISLNELSA